MSERYTSLEPHSVRLTFIQTWRKGKDRMDNVARNNTGRRRPYIFDYGKYNEEQCRFKYRVTKAAFRELPDIISAGISAHKD